MATQPIDLSIHAALTRRSLLRAGGYASAAATLSALPFGNQVLAMHDVGEDWPNVAALAKKYVEERKVANLFLTFGWGQEDHAHTVGGGRLSLAGGAEVDENTLYRIYSMTKPITGMATMMLIDEGKLGLDQPLYDIIPAFRDIQVLVDPVGPLDNTVKPIRPITIRQLLTHTAGLGYQITSQGPLLDAYNKNGLVGGRLSRFPIPGVPTVIPAPGLEMWTQRLASLPLMFQPATKWSYSCSLDLLGRVIEVVSGQEFETFLKQRLFDPLGMASTWMTVPQSQKGRLTDNYAIDNGKPFPIDPGVNSVYLDPPEVPAGGGGLVSSPKDYDRFLRMVLGYGRLGKERVMSESAVRIGVSDLLPETVDLTGSWVAGQGHGAGGRSVNGTFGWGGAAGTLGAVDFKLGLRAGLWTQYLPSDSYPIRNEYLAALEADTAAMRAKKKAA